MLQRGGEADREKKKKTFSSLNLEMDTVFLKKKGPSAIKTIMSRAEDLKEGGERSSEKGKKKRSVRGWAVLRSKGGKEGGAGLTRKKNFFS